MGDSGAERKVRDILGKSEFDYQGKRYKIVINAKPTPETKTDFYILARRLDDEMIEKEFKISYKNQTYTFIENKIRPERIQIIYGDEWSKILLSQIHEKNPIEVNQHWKKVKPEEHLEDSFKTFPLINFKSGAIMLGWRYEIEQLDAPGISRRTHSARIEQDITPQIFWGESCRDNMRDAVVNGDSVENSGVPDYILIRDPNEIHSANDVFKNIQDIREYAERHNEMRAGFISQYYRWSKKHDYWKTEEWARVFAVWIKWDVVDGNLVGKPVFDRPFERTARQVFENLCECLDAMNLTKPKDKDHNFDIETLRNRLAPSTVSKG